MLILALSILLFLLVAYQIGTSLRDNDPAKRENEQPRAPRPSRKAYDDVLQEILEDVGESAHGPRPRLYTQAGGLSRRAV